MAVTTGPRTGVTLWSVEADPVTRTQFQATHTSIEALMAVDVQQTLPLPAPGVRGRYIWATDDRGGRLYRDSGAALFDLGPKPVDGPATGYTARISAHASAAIGDDVLQLRGKTGQTGNLFRVTDPTGATTYQRVASAGQLISEGASTALVYGARTTGDTVDRFAVRGDALLSFSGGSAAADLFLSRNSAGRLNLDGTLQVQNPATGGAPLSFVTLALQAAAGQTGLLLAARDSGAFNRFTVGTDGDLRILDTDGTTRLIELQASSGGIFATGGSSYFGPFAMGGSATGPRARILASGASIGFIAESDAALTDVNVLYRIKGTGTHRFQNEGSIAQLTIDNVGTLLAGDGTTALPSIGFLNTPGMGLFRQAASQMGLRVPAAGYFSFRGSGTEVARLTDVGSFAAIAADSYFGPGALGASDARLRVSRLSASDAGVIAENPVTSTASLRLRPSGTTGVVSLQTNAGVDIVQTDTSTSTLRALLNPGTNLTAHPAGAALSARGLSVTADSATVQGGPSAGIGIAIARVDPALTINNASGPALSTWAGAAKKFQVDQSGTIQAVAVDHYFGPGAFGSTGMRVHVWQQGVTSIWLKAEDQAGALQTMNIQGSSTVMWDAAGNPIASFNAKTASSGQTSIGIQWLNGAAWTGSTIQVGATDSAGVGFRQLRISN